MLANVLFVKNCSITQGLAFFMLIPSVSVCFSTSLAFLCSSLYRHARLVFVAILLFSLLYDVAMGYFTPAIFAYNFFYGFFPGITYDELLEVSFSLVIFRLLTILMGALFLWLSILVVRHCSAEARTITKHLRLFRTLVAPPRVAATLLIGAALFAIGWFKGELGFASSSGFIREKLGSSFETDHCVLYYSNATFSPEEIRWIGAEHEFRYNQIANALQLLTSHERIESYIYPSAEEKRRYIGAGTTSIAKPWSHQIHLTADSFDDVLKHELVHVLAAPFGVPLIRASLYPGLTEGLAMALEWDWGNRTLHEYAAFVMRAGLRVDLERLMSGIGFAAQPSSISYVLSGSFCRFLIDTRGIRQMTRLYRSGDYQGVYGKSLGELVHEWRGMLESITVSPDEWNDVVDVYFRRPPIFRQVCVRVIAATNAEGRKELAAKNYQAAALLFRYSFSEGRGYEALSGYLTSELRAGNYGALTSALDTIIMRQEFPGRFLPLLVPIGDAFWKLGDTASAQAVYDRVARTQLSESLTEAATIRLLALQHFGEADAFLRYFLSGAPDSVRVLHLDTLITLKGAALARYLKGKLVLRQKRYEDAAAMLAEASLLGTNDELEAFRLRTLGRALFRLRRFQEARSMFWMSLNPMSNPADINKVNEWLDRCEWFEKNHRQFDLQ
jgi:hypothetical protein